MNASEIRNTLNTNSRAEAVRILAAAFQPDPESTSNAQHIRDLTQRVDVLERARTERRGDWLWRLLRRAVGR